MTEKTIISCGTQFEEMEQGGSHIWTCSKINQCKLCSYKQKVKEAIDSLKQRAINKGNNDQVMILADLKKELELEA